MKTTENLQRHVLEELAWDPAVDSTHIAITVNDGVVHLQGYVGSFAEKLAAEKATRRIRGVEGIVDDLEIRLIPPFLVKDEQIAKSAVEALKQHITVPKNAVTVTVDNGWVQLTGEVQWYYQKQAAENAMRYLPGVINVTNNIRLVHRVDKSEIRQKIEAAFKRSALIDSDQVKVETKDGKVVLKGTVRSWAERSAAEDAAWLATGVTEVQNDLKVAWPAVVY
jgi:osmotically-inducible protein OsmY